MKPLLRIIVVALIAAAVATIIVQRERIREIETAELAGQIRKALEQRLSQRPAEAVDEADSDEEQAA